MKQTKFPYSFFRAFLLLGSLFFLWAVSQAAVPQTLHFQGQLVESGTPVTGDRYFKFSLVKYDGLTETLVWPGTSGGIQSVLLSLTDGVFSHEVEVGSIDGPSLADLTNPANQPLYLKIRVSPDDVFYADFGYSPLTSVPFALAAQQAETAVTAQGVLAGSIGLNELSTEVQDQLGQSGGGGISSQQLIQILGTDLSYSEVANQSGPVFIDNTLNSTSEVPRFDKTFVISIPVDECGLSAGDYLFPFSVNVFGQTDLTLLAGSGRISVLDGELGFLQFNADPCLFGSPGADPASIPGVYPFSLQATDGSQTEFENFNLVVEPAGMRYVPAGTFFMGDAMYESTNDERPLRTVTISRPLFVDEVEMSQGEWLSVRSSAIGSIDGGYVELSTGWFFDDDEQPIRYIPWKDIILWLNAKSLLEGLDPVYFLDAQFTTVFTPNNVDDIVTNPDTPDYDVYANLSANGYRLPTEAEWEYFARGTKSGKRYPWGNDDPNLTYVLYSPSGFSAPEPTAVIGADRNFSRWEPNGFGLRHLAGNIGEFVWDVYSSSGYSATSSTVTDPLGPDGSGTVYTSRERVYRGGDYTSNAIELRVANREKQTETSQTLIVSFRVVRNASFD